MEFIRARLLTLGLFAVGSMFAVAAMADIAAPTIIPPGGFPVSVLEGKPGPQVSFTVHNNANIPLELDYALAIIKTTNDKEDWLHFAGKNGSQGLAGAPCLILPANGNCVYVYNTITDAADPGPVNDGINTFSFGAEFRPLGNPGIVIQNQALGVNLVITQVDPENIPLYNQLVGQVNAANPTNPCQLDLFTPPNCPLLFADGVAAVDQFGASPASVIINVSDTPEPEVVFPVFGFMIAFLWLRFRPRRSRGPLSE